jgi:hypothetical protein
LRRVRRRLNGSRLHPDLDRLTRLFRCLPHARYAPIRSQRLELRLRVNGRRETAGLEPVRGRALRPPRWPFRPSGKGPSARPSFGPAARPTLIEARADLVRLAQSSRGSLPPRFPGTVWQLRIVPHRQSSSFEEIGHNVGMLNVYKVRTHVGHLRLAPRFDRVSRPHLSAVVGKALPAMHRS